MAARSARTYVRPHPLCVITDADAYTYGRGVRGHIDRIAGVALASPPCAVAGLLECCPQNPVKRTARGRRRVRPETHRGPSTHPMMEKRLDDDHLEPQLCTPYNISLPPTRSRSKLLLSRSTLSSEGELRCIRHPCKCNYACDWCGSVHVVILVRRYLKNISISGPFALDR
jgi:hypothetical protein